MLLGASDSTGLTGPLSGLVTAWYVEYFGKIRPRASAPLNLWANTYENPKNHLIPFLELIKCCWTSSDAIGPTESLSELITNGYVKFSEKNGPKPLHLM